MIGAENVLPPKTQLRMRVFNLIRDLTSDAFGGWNMITTLQSGGGLKAQRVMMNRSFDLRDATRRALDAAHGR